MAKRLTEEMVIARTKISDLSKIKRLNCWGSELDDVSILRRMPYVEVLSLSINNISSLEDLQYCRRLEELYIRQNDIRDINQICYLQNLPNLRNLWLGENPCAKLDGYRLAVLRALPQLQKLDNIAVTSDELKDAQRKGIQLSHPEDVDASEENIYSPRYREYADNEQEYCVQRNTPEQEQEYETEDPNEIHTSGDLRIDDPPVSHSTEETQRRPETVRRNYSPEQEYVERKNSYERESSPQQYCDISPFINSNEEYIHTENCRETRLLTSQSTNSIKEYVNGERYSHQHRQNEAGDVINYQSHEGTQQRRERHTCSASYRPPFNRRPITRNSNILSAVLCLVKELDYPSLEVVEMAVRCRMDELDE